MLNFALSWPGLKERLDIVLDAYWRRWAGAAFVVLALFAIEYDEIIAPGMHRLSGAWGAAATDIGRKLASLAL